MFDACIQKFIHDRMIALPDTINSMMQFHMVSCDEAKQEVVLCFPVMSWQINLMHTMHGGMISTAFDITMGCLSFACNGGSPNPTIEMQVRFLKGVREQDELIIKAHAIHVGKRMVQVEAHAYVNASCVAQADASYMINHKESE